MMDDLVPRDVPDEGGAIVPARGETFAVSREGQRTHAGVMAGVHRSRLACLGVPDTDRGGAAHDQRLAVGGKGEMKDAVLIVRLENLHDPFALCVEEVDGITAQTGEELAVRAEGG